MANLVRPVNLLPPAEERTIEFKGLNKKSVIEDGEMSDMWNLTADSYPLLMPRKPRGVLDLPSDVMRPIQIVKRFGKIGLVAIDNEENIEFYYDGVKYPEVSQLVPLTASTRAVAINTKICFFPQKTYITIRQTPSGIEVGDAGRLEASVSVSSGTTVEINVADTRIEIPKDSGLKYDDAITITGTITYTAGGASHSSPINVSCIIEQFIEGETTDTLVLPANTFIEVIGQGATQVSLLASTITRGNIPDMDLVVEWNNRLWGASSITNTIYACKLGDPTNWQYYQGTGLDSYYAEQGTDESFTGIAEYSGHLIFFKPNSMTRVYGTSPSNYQITNAKAYGVEEGSSNSVLTINDAVYYKSAIGIMAYQGGTPFCISDKLNRKFKNVVAGTEGTKYYASLIVEADEGYEGRTIVFDIAKGMWHLEDNLRFLNACKIGDKIYCTTASAEVLVCGEDIFCARDLMVSTDIIEGEAIVINPDEPSESYDDIEWMAQFGPFDEYIEEHKIYSKLAMRVKANGEASAKVYISLDEGPWEQVENYEHVSTKGDFIPIVPRRCDRYSVKIEGKGNMEIKSLTRRVRKGSFGRL